MKSRFLRGLRSADHDPSKISEPGLKGYIDRLDPQQIEMKQLELNALESESASLAEAATQPFSWDMEEDVYRRFKKLSGRTQPERP